MGSFKVRVVAQSEEDRQKAKTLEALLNDAWSKVPDDLLDQARLDVFKWGRVEKETEQAILRHLGLEGK